MATKHTLKRGSTRPALRYPLPGVDLTGATATFLMSARPGQPPTVNAPAVVTYGALEYHWRPGDTDHAITHFGEFEVVFPGGAIETFPADDYIRIEVRQDIGDGGTVAPPALITLTGALVEAGGDVASGAGAVTLALSGSLIEAGSDTAAGTGTVTTPPPGSISLSADLTEAGADTASGTASVGITASAALVETGTDTAAGTGTVTTPITAQRVIILTDYAGDCDDAMALGVACAAHKRGDIHILGVVATSSIETSAPGVHGQLAAYGMQSIPVYAYQGSIGTYNNNISAPVRDAHGIPGQTRAAFEDDLTGLRRMLAGSPDGSVKVIDIGAPISTARLLDSPADAISALTGMQLASAKVSGLWMMAGDFTGGTAEYNATRHIASTQRVYHDWPTPLYAHGSEVGGDVNTGPHRSFEMPGLDPIKTAFDAYGTAQRMSWDPITVHHAIYGNGTLYRHAGEGGTISVDATGVTTWAASPAGNRTYVAKLAGQGTISAAIVNFVYSTDLIPINAQSQWAFPLNEGAGVVVTADTNAKGSIVNAAWAASPARLNFTSDHALIPLRSADHDKDFVLGAIIRLGAVSGAQVIMSRTGTLASNKFWQFRNNAGALEWVSFDAAGTGTVIASAAGALVANTWTLVTARVTDTGALLRINGAEVKTGTFPVRNKLLDPAVPVMVSGRSNTTTWSGTPLDRMTSGDVAGLALRLASSDVAALEADLRTIATVKGITLP